MSVFPGSYAGSWGWHGGLLPYPREAPAAVDPDAKATDVEPVARHASYAGPGIFPAFPKTPGWEWWLAYHMRDYPMVGLVLTAITAPILSAPRTLEVRNEDGTDAGRGKQIGPRIGDGITEAPEDKLKAALERHFEPLWPDILSGLKECIHLGFWLQETLWDRVNTPAGSLMLPVTFRDFTYEELLGRQVELLHENGEFAGFEYRSPKAGATPERRDPRYALHFLEDGHLNPLYGRGRSVSALAAWWRAMNSQENGDRIERKASGISLMIQVMSGITLKDAAGNTVTSDSMAQDAANTLGSGGTWVTHMLPIPKDRAMQNPELLKIPVATAEQFDWGSTADAIRAQIERVNALDVQIIRAYGRRERSLVEGQHGTKAEAGEHKDSDELDGQQLAERTMRQFSRQTLDTLLVTNFGPEWRGRIYAKAGPLADDAKAWLREVVAGQIGQPGTPASVMFDAREAMKKAGAPIDDNAKMPMPLDGPPTGEGGGQQDDEGVEFDTATDDGSDDDDEPAGGNGRLRSLGLSSSSSSSSCGANAAGGGGFQPGNKCGGNGNGTATAERPAVPLRDDGLPDPAKLEGQKAIARALRKGMEKATGGDPKDQCINAAHALKLVYPEAEIWAGKFDGEYHTVTRLGGRYIDVTADQFQGGSRIVVRRELPGREQGGSYAGYRKLNEEPNEREAGPILREFRKRLGRLSPKN